MPLPRFLNNQTPAPPFEIYKSGDSFLVNHGICFSTFNYGTGSYIPIEGINQPFPFKKGEKFYIDLSISNYLQVTGAKIQCTRVGINKEVESESKMSPIVWENYPSMIYTQPEDKYDDKGRVTSFAEGKRQLKCYGLIGYRADDMLEDPLLEVDSKNTGVSSPVQVLNSNIILLASMYSGVPCIFPVPYFGDADFVQSIYSPTTSDNKGDGNKDDSNGDDDSFKLGSMKPQFTDIPLGLGGVVGPSL